MTCTSMGSLPLRCWALRATNGRAAPRWRRTSRADPGCPGAAALAGWLAQLKPGLHAVGHLDLHDLGLPPRPEHAQLAAALQPRRGHLRQVRHALAAQVLPQVALGH